MPSSADFSSEAHRWQLWLKDHGEVFFLYARQQTRSEADAKDVFQEALVEAWRKSGEATPDKAMVLATIRRRAIDLGRSMDRRTVREQRVCGEAPAWLVTDYAENDTREFLRAAISGLPEALREVLILRIWGDLSFPAIARLTDVPLATATSRYRYALERLRGTLTELKP
jgi:RNA polymerase sigma-70 factor (ECF subfamily)